MIFLEPKWALSQQPTRPKAEWAIDSEAMRVHERNNNKLLYYYYCFSKIQLVRQEYIEKKTSLQVKARQNAIRLPLFWFSKPALVATNGL